jgi:putative Mg2+ transporter-C (MgtC) family protein
MMIALAAATFTIITFELMASRQLAGGGNSDPIRIVEAVTADVAFLAAGAIHGRGVVTGVTTGSSMRLVAAIGVACGAGDYTIAVMATALTVVILALVARIERWIGTKDASGVKAPRAKPDR